MIGTTERGTIRVSALELDLAGYRASFSGRSLALSRSGFELLVLLASNRHRVLPRRELAESLGLARGRSVDVLLTGLRRAIGHEFVRNVRGRGWIIEPALLED